MVPPHIPALYAGSILLWFSLQTLRFQRTEHHHIMPRNYKLPQSQKGEVNVVIPHHSTLKDLHYLTSCVLATAVTTVTWTVLPI